MIYIYIYIYVDMFDMFIYNFSIKKKYYIYFI